MTPLAVGVTLLVAAYVAVAVLHGHRLWSATRTQVRIQLGHDVTAIVLARELMPWLIGCAIWPAMTMYALVRNRR